ncbi:MAG: spore maturation protein A [Clostridia bacterium]|nr:spore maturation protein A [Clostridia bacterium]
MLSRILFVLLAFSIPAAIVTGNLSDLGTAALEGAQSGLSLTLSMGGALCLWSGLLEVLERAGITGKLAGLTQPLLRWLIRPKSSSGEVDTALSENFTANLLGLGNAATPAGLRAAALLDAQDDPAAVSRLVLLNSCSVQLLPFTAAGLRAAAGSNSPFAILPVVLAASLVSLVVSFGVYRVLTHD